MKKLKMTERKETRKKVKEKAEKNMAIKKIWKKMLCERGGLFQDSGRKSERNSRAEKKSRRRRKISLRFFQHKMRSGDPLPHLS